jgi:multiple sugar transport system permease protein
MAYANRMAGRATSNRILMIAVGILALVWAFPIIWVVALSFKPNMEIMTKSSGVLEPPYTLINYLNILVSSNVFRWTFNSLIVATVQTATTLVLASLAGYGFARADFKGRNVVFVLTLAGLAIPEYALVIARHQMFSQLGWHNTYHGLILPGLASPFGVFLMTQYFKAIPVELDEAAAMDNASRLKTFFMVLLPLTLPAQATLGIFSFLGAWNDYFWPLISATNQSMYTLTTGLGSMSQNFAQTESVGFLMAQAVFAGLPMIVLYIFFQKYIIRAASGSAVG